MKNENYITIQGWMVNNLNLSGNELICYAIIFGFSQDKESAFGGSLNYIAESLNTTKEGARRVIKRLVEKGVIAKTDFVMNGVKFCKYSANFDTIDGSTPPAYKVSHPGLQSTPPPGLQSKTNNTNIYNTNDNTSKEIYKEVRFDFKKAVLDLGVEEQVLKDWLLVRKNKKAANTETAFKRLVKEIQSSGHSANECIRIAAENSWQGFKAEWIKRTTYGTNNSTKETRQSDMQERISRMLQ